MKKTINHNILNSPDSISDESVDNLLERFGGKFMCQVCLKFFSSKHCLKEHGYIHSNVKPYKCRNCSKVFKHASQLSLHKKIHLKIFTPVWPKLTQMLSLANQKEEIIEVIEDKVELPLIASPQAWILPKIII